MDIIYDKEISDNRLNAYYITLLEHSKSLLFTNFIFLTAEKQHFFPFLFWTSEVSSAAYGFGLTHSLLNKMRDYYVGILGINSKPG